MNRPNHPSFSLAGRELADVNNIVSLFDLTFLLRIVQRRARKSHESSTGRLQDAEGGYQLQEGVYPRGLRGP